MTLSWTDAIAMEPYADLGSYQEPAGFDVDFFSPDQKSSFSWSDMNDAGLLDKDNFLSQYSNPFKGIATNSGSGSGISHIAPSGISGCGPKKSNRAASVRFPGGGSATL